MAKKSGKELEYQQQLETLGIYSPAFDGEIHQLCILERELSRARKEWKATVEAPAKSPSFSHPLYGVITQIQREILARRDALGLTPKALRKLKGSLDLGNETEPEDKTVLGFVLSKHEDR